MDSTTPDPLTQDGVPPSTQKPNGTIHSPSTRTTFTPKLLPIQLIILAVYPVTVLLGMISNHPPDSYFAQKDNFINVVFLKMGWAWTSIAFFLHLSRIPRKVAPLGRYVVATIWWILVTQCASVLLSWIWFDS